MALNESGTPGNDAFDLFGSMGPEDVGGSRPTSPFERVPIPLVEIDASPLSALASELRMQGVEDVARHLEGHPHLLDRLCERSAVRGGNAEALTLLGIPSQTVLHRELPSLLGAGWRTLLAGALEALFEGCPSTTMDLDARCHRWQSLHLRVTVGLPPSDEEGAPALLAITDLTRETRHRRLYRLMAEQVGTSTGARWLRQAVGFLSEHLGADLAFVARMEDGGQRFQALSLMLDGTLLPHEDEPLRCPVCRRAVDAGVALYSEEPAPTLDESDAVGRLVAKGVAAAPVHGDGDTTLGVVAAAFRSSVEDQETVVSLLELVASRAAAEIERAMAEEHHAELEAQLVHAQRLESVGRLAGGIAHDFNNLLAPIMAYAEMAMEGLADDDEVRDDLEEVLRAAERASRVTRKLLAFSRRQVMDIHAMDLAGVLQGFMRMIRNVIREDIQVQLEPSERREVILGDEGQIEQILMNLILNAQDAMPDGGRLLVRTRPETVEQERNGLPEGSYVCLEIADTGTGMDEDTCALIFEPFFTTKEAHEGTGLGLAVVYGIMQQLGGTVEVDSEVGVGTTFRLYFRASQQAEAADTAVPSPRQTGLGFERVLVVEDEALVRRVIISMLRRNGYQVIAAATPSEALELALDPAVPLDLLISDVVMPEMTGVEMYEQIQRSRPTLPVLYLSGYAHDVLEARGVQTVNLLEKPFSQEAFLERVREILD